MLVNASTCMVSAARRFRLRLCLISCIVLVVGCPKDSGGGEEGSGGTEGGTGDGGVCAPVEPEVLDCDEVNAAAHAAPQIPACDDGTLAAPMPPPAGTPAFADFEDWFLDQWPGLVSETDPAKVGAWTEVIANDVIVGETELGHLPVHSIHRPTGKFVHFGAQHGGGTSWDVTGDKTVWFPPAPCSPFEEPNGIEDCDNQFDFDPQTQAIETHVHVDQSGGEPDMTEHNLFCSAHVTLLPWNPAELLRPRSLTVGGALVDNINAGIANVFMFDEALPSSAPFDTTDYTWLELDPLSQPRWYPGIVTLASGALAVPGGVATSTGTLQCTKVEGGLAQSGEQCACDPQDQQDPFVLAGICGDDGYCDPEASSTVAGVTCALTNQGVAGIEVGVRTGPDAVAWTMQAAGESFAGYPQLHLLPDLPVFTSSGTNLGGKVVNVGGGAWRSGDGAWVWDPSTPEAGVDKTLGGPSCAPASSSVMLAEDKILKFGGGLGGTRRASRLTEILDLSGACPQWRRPEGSQMAMPRNYASGVLLPTGDVLTAGGTMANGNEGDENNDKHYAAFTAELFQRDTETWCRLADLPGADDLDEDFLGQHTYRGYHSQAFLLRDGRVYVGAGGNLANGVETHYDYMLYAPPYLFKGPRPQIEPGSGETVANDILVMQAGGSMVELSRLNQVEIDRVTLVKLSSSTHNFDFEQRFVELDIVGGSASHVEVEPPPSTCYATPGYYMLFAISTLGVPSLGQYVVIDGSCAAANVSVVVPQFPSPDPIVINDLFAGGFEGLQASCGGFGSVLRLEDFRQSLLALCTAMGSCPQDGAVEVEVRFVSTTGDAGAQANDLLASAEVAFTNGVPSITNGAIEIDVSNVPGGPAVPSAPLGPGEHVVSVCGVLGALSGCVQQPLRIDAVLAGADHDEYRAGAIEPGDLLVRELPSTVLDLGDDDVVQVPLPPGFVFPFHGELVETIWVGSNGAIRIDAGTVPATNASLPHTGGPHIAAYWDDLDPSAGGSVRTFHDGPRFIVAWDEVPVVNGGVVSVQAHLWRDGRIELHYPSVSTGPDAHGDSATIGIQYDGDALALSVNDDALLHAHEALALDTASCLASALRIPDALACRDRVATAPAEVPICAGSSDVKLTLPKVPSICSPHRDAIVTGEVWLAGDRQSVQDDGTVELFVADYETRWSIRSVQTFGTRGSAFLTVGEQALQPVQVRLSDAAGVCCRDDQGVEVLTSGDDRETLGAHEAVCVVALTGDDLVHTGAHDDTLLGHEGNDSLAGEGGDDVILGGVGDDTLLGGNGDDVLFGQDGSDALRGGAGDDELWGGAGEDDLLGGDGADVIIPGPGLDHANGEAGDDHVVVLHLCEVESGETLDGGSGTDTLWLPSGVTVSDLQNLGATVSGFEDVRTIQLGMWGTSECAL